MKAEAAREKFVDWLARRMTLAGRGDRDDVLEVEPSGKYWLGRLQSAEAVAESDWGDRAVTRSSAAPNAGQCSQWM